MLNLKNISQIHQDTLVREYREVKTRYQRRDWGPGELKAGRFSEAVLRIFQELLGIPFTPYGQEITSPEKTRIINLVQNSSGIDEHVRQKVTALVRLLLDFRNNRDVGHLGGFDANPMDAAFTLTACNWIVAELVRVYSGMTMEQAEELCEQISEKEYPALVNIENEEFITKPDLKASEEVLVWLYIKGRLDRKFLFQHTKDSNSSRFQDSLKKLVVNKMIAEHSDKSFSLLPIGLKYVEENKLLEVH